MNVTRLHNENASALHLQLHLLYGIGKNLNIEDESFFGYSLFPTQFEYAIEVYGAERKIAISKFVYLCIIRLLTYFTELEFWTIQVESSYILTRPQNFAKSLP